jgi:hypothetical protein
MTDQDTPNDRRPGHVLLNQLRGGLVMDVVEEEVHEVGGVKSMEIRLKISEDDVETAAFGLIFMIATLSFSDALPAGYSKNHFRHDDEYSVTDFLQHLSFRDGRLHWATDYVRGRLMKTTVHIDRQGNVLLRALNRDELPRRWLGLMMNLKVEPEDGAHDVDGDESAME